MVTAIRELLDFLEQFSLQCLFGRRLQFITWQTSMWADANAIVLFIRQAGPWMAEEVTVYGLLLAASPTEEMNSGNPAAA